VDVTIKTFTGQADIQRLIELYASGLNADQIAPMFNTSASTVRKYLREGDITMRTRWDYHNAYWDDFQYLTVRV
jgi:transposase